MKPKRLSGSTGRNPGPRDYRSIQEGTPVAFPIITREGKIGVQNDPFGAIGVDPARGQFVRVGGGLAIEQGSPYRIVPVLGAGVEINGAGEIVPSLSSSVRLNARNKLVATPSLAEVTDPENPGQDAVAALARKANTGDARFPIARGIATLVAGSVTVALATINTGAIIVLNHEQFAGSPGLLSYSVIASTSFTIASNDPADTSTVAYAVWNP